MAHSKVTKTQHFCQYIPLSPTHWTFKYYSVKLRRIWKQTVKQEMFVILKTHQKVNVCCEWIAIMSLHHHFCWLCSRRQEVICWTEGSHNNPSTLCWTISHILNSNIHNSEYHYFLLYVQSAFNRVRQKLAKKRFRLTHQLRLHHWFLTHSWGAKKGQRGCFNKQQPPKHKTSVTSRAWVGWNKGPLL